ncbi:BrnT family toxin [Neorhizobium galegae]|uniref:BrnT family toxin n=1 Tax=Neorhizobium galegae TaxID=399 RepID=UPI001F341A40|nr:BrnT family toxin [Neorhizobium galegae]UIK03900.1 BrnT family toxin [Neorhizobium galegae]
MLFEFDPDKSAANKDKHGIDLVEAQALWADEKLFIMPAKDDREPRLMVIGEMDEKLWSAICVYRGERIRIISVRRSRKLEVEVYESR